MTHNFFEQGDPGHLQLLKVKIESSELRQGKDSRKRQVLNEVLFEHIPANIPTSLLLVTVIQLNRWKLSGSTSQPYSVSLSSIVHLNTSCDEKNSYNVRDKY